ncbi:MAG: hypothetical protein HQL96_14045 [Magnetococcales bacterium]|nr:hypothetical protein [Magnetococcales bacterium]
MHVIDSITIEKILNQYDQQKKHYSDFLERTLTLIKEFIAPDGPKIHSIVGRIKEKESLAEKLDHPPEAYQTLADVPDIAGIRIITFFEEEVQVVTEIIRREFNVFPSREQPKYLLTDPNRFGYTSANWQLGLLDNRLELIEYRRFRGFLVELQVRSVLQHAWLEINKSLGFQTREHCPPQKQREYGRIAALFELADLELNKIRSHAHHPAPGVRPASPGRPEMPPEPLPEAEAAPEAPRGQATLLEKPLGANRIRFEDMERLVLDNRLVIAQDRKIADLYDTRLIFKQQSIVTLTDAFHHLDIGRVGELEEALKAFEKIIKPLGLILFGDPAVRKYEHLSKGNSLLVLACGLAAKTGHTNTVFQYIGRFAFENDPTQPGISTELIECVNKHLNR